MSTRSRNLSYRRAGGQTTHRRELFPGEDLDGLDGNEEEEEEDEDEGEGEEEEEDLPRGPREMRRRGRVPLPRTRKHLRCNDEDEVKSIFHDTSQNCRCY